MPLTAGPSSSPVTRKLIEPAIGPCATARERGGDGRGEAALHVAGAAAPDHPLGDRRAERVEPPPGGIAGRHDVGMAGENEMRRPRPDARVEIVDARRAGLGERDDLGGKARLGEEVAQIGQGAVVGRGHRAAGDQPGGDLDGAGRRKIAHRSKFTRYRGRISRTRAAQSSATS